MFRLQPWVALAPTLLALSGVEEETGGHRRRFSRDSPEVDWTKNREHDALLPLSPMSGASNLNDSLWRLGFVEVWILGMTLMTVGWSSLDTSGVTPQTVNI
jgi:hypothetical protein